MGILDPGKSTSSIQRLDSESDLKSFEDWKEINLRKYVYVFVSVCVYVYVCVYIERELCFF